MKPIEIRLVGRYRFHSRLEGDHQCLLYKAIHTQTNETLFLKGEQVKQSKPKKGCLSLLQQGKIYQSMQGGIGIPYMHWCGQDEDFNFIVLQEMDSTLASKILKCEAKISLKSTLMLGIQLLTILQYYHFKYFTYNNLHPRHIMLGKGEKYGKFFLVDFSRSNRFTDPQTSEHVTQFNERVSQLRNHNLQFSSINFHKGVLTSRKDDLESLLYLVLYLIKGQLPWSYQVRNMKKTDFQKSRTVLQIKTNTAQVLFEGFPELQSLKNYLQSLRFEQKPQYSYFASTFSHMMERRGLIDDKIYDWMLLDDEEEIQQFSHCFQIFDKENEFVNKIAQQYGRSSNNDKISRITKTNEKISPNKAKNEKECVIY